MSVVGVGRGGYVGNWGNEYEDDGCDEPMTGGGDESTDECDESVDRIVFVMMGCVVCVLFWYLSGECDETLMTWLLLRW